MASERPDALQQLIDVVARLRDPDQGCPWDLKQTHASLVPYVLEEAHEVADAIRHGDDSHLKEELGDLLFTLVNVARWCRLDPEEGLAGTNHRFLDRFSRVESALGGNLQGRSIQDLEALWQAAKAQIRAEQAAIHSSGVGR